MSGESNCAFEPRIADSRSDVRWCRYRLIAGFDSRGLKSAIALRHSYSRKGLHQQFRKVTSSEHEVCLEGAQVVEQLVLPVEDLQ